MNIHEKEAIIDYLEFTLLNFVTKFETHLCSDAVGPLYEEAYGLLNDMDNTLDITLPDNQWVTPE